MSVLLPNMNLVVSTIGVDSGLNWETNLNADLTILDNHNHTPGNGVPIPTNGININQDFPLNNYQAIDVKSILFKNQSSLATVNALYTVGGELFYNDPSGAVQITLGGVVNATASGISSGAASASFSAGVLVVNSAANTPANIQCGSVLLGNNVAASKFLTLSPPAAMAANYSVTLPTLPSVNNSIMALSTAGVMSALYTVDNTTIQISANVIQVKAGGIGTTQLAAGGVTKPKLAALGQTLSSSCGVFTTSSASFVDVTNLGFTQATSGRPLMLFLQNDSSATSSYIEMSSLTPLYYGTITILVDGGQAFNYDFPLTTNPQIWAGGLLLGMYVPSSPNTTLQVQAKVSNASAILSIANYKLVAYEL